MCREDFDGRFHGVSELANYLLPVVQNLDYYLKLSEIAFRRDTKPLYSQTALKQLSEMDSIMIEFDRV